MNVKRYIYTKDKGWIDVHHFFYMAEYTREHGVFEAADYAGWSEFAQEWYVNPESGWSYEDLASNYAGIYFWDYYGADIESGKLTIMEAFEDLMKRFGATEPEDAPNYDYIPYYVDSDYLLKSKEKNGLKGETLRARMKKIFETRPKEDQEKIKKAHKADNIINPGQGAWLPPIR